MGIAVLGPLTVAGDGSLSPRDRVVLSALVVRSGSTISTEQLADALWGDQPPASWGKVVPGCITRLRKRLGADSIETVAGGYRLAVADDEVDVRRFERLAAKGHQLLALGEPDRAALAFRESLGPVAWPRVPRRGGMAPRPGRGRTTRRAAARSRGVRAGRESEGRAPGGGPRRGQGPGIGGTAARTALGAAGARAVPLGCPGRCAAHAPAVPRVPVPGARARSGARAGRPGECDPPPGPVAHGSGRPAEAGGQVSLSGSAPLRHRRRGLLLRSGRRSRCLSSAPRRAAGAGARRPLGVRQVLATQGGR